MTPRRPAAPVPEAVRPRTAGRAARGRKRGNRRLTALVVALALGATAAGIVALGDPVGEVIKEVTLPLRHDDVIRQQARDKQLDAALIAAVIYRESKFRDQTSEAGARGLMQILPDTADFVARRTGGTEFEQTDLSDPQINIAYGTWYLRYLFDRYDGNAVAAVAAYNAGHQRVDRWGGKSLAIGDIRFPETREYTGDVLEKRDEYADHYGEELGL